MASLLLFFFAELWRVEERKHHQAKGSSPPCSDFFTCGFSDGWASVTLLVKITANSLNDEV
jgi:hypothetical protein